MRFARIVVLGAVLAAVIAPAALAFGFTDDDFVMPEGIVGTPYSFQMKAREGCPPYSFFVISGSLPAGLTMPSNGLISGTPTTPGSSSFWIDVTDQCSDHSQREFSINIIQKLTVTTTALTATTVGVSYAAALTATGGSSLIWSISAGSLPAGLTLSTDGIISGTPTTVGSSTFTVKVTDGGPRSDTHQLTLQVLAPLAATTPAVPPAEVSRPFTTTLTATGGLAPYTWSVAEGTLPSGLALDGASGALAGTPTVAGSFPLKLAVSDANGSSVTVDIELTIAAKLAIATTRLPAAKVGHAYKARVVTRGGVVPLKRRIRGKLPPGLRFNNATGAIVGIARKAGTFTVTVEVVDRVGASSTSTFVITARP